MNLNRRVRQVKMKYYECVSPTLELYVPRHCREKKKQAQIPRVRTQGAEILDKIRKGAGGSSNNAKSSKACFLFKGAQLKKCRSGLANAHV